MRRQVRGAECERCACRKLLALNPNNYKYHDGVRAALQLQPDAQGRWTDQQRWQLTLLYTELAEQHPSSSAIRRLPLDFKVSPQPFLILNVQGAPCSKT